MLLALRCAGSILQRKSADSVPWCHERRLTVKSAKHLFTGGLYSCHILNPASGMMQKEEFTSTAGIAPQQEVPAPTVRTCLPSIKHRPFPRNTLPSPSSLHLPLLFPSRFSLLIRPRPSSASYIPPFFQSFLVSLYSRASLAPFFTCSFFLCALM